MEVEKDDETDDMYDFQPVDIPANDISEGVLLLVDTAILRRICGVSANFRRCVDSLNTCARSDSILHENKTRYR